MDFFSSTFIWSAGHDWTCYMGLSVRSKTTLHSALFLLLFLLLLSTSVVVIFGEECFPCHQAFPWSS